MDATAWVLSRAVFSITTSVVVPRFDDCSVVVWMTVVQVSAGSDVLLEVTGIDGVGVRLLVLVLLVVVGGSGLGTTRVGVLVGEVSSTTSASVVVLVSPASLGPSGVVVVVVLEASVGTG